MSFARLPGADSRLRRSVLGVLVTTIMGAIFNLYGYLDYLARQILPDTADGVFLERHAGIFSMTRKAATVATGQVTATGVNGAAIPAGTVLQRAGAQLATRLAEEWGPPVYSDGSLRVWDLGASSAAPR